MAKTHTLRFPDGRKLRTGTTRRYVVVWGDERPFVAYRTDSIERASDRRSKTGGWIFDVEAGVPVDNYGRAK
jgi:hypothetical protein